MRSTECPSNWYLKYSVRPYHLMTDTIVSADITLKLFRKNVTLQ